MQHDFNQRRENRIKYAEDQAIKKEKQADDLYESAKDMAAFIPFGQPILVGHHSEKRDRNYRAKIHNRFDQSFKSRDKAAYYAAKAESIAANGAIFSDDPKALPKLKEKLKSLESAQEFMKAANKCLKKGDREGFLKLSGASPDMWEKLADNSKGWGIGFAHYSLSNNNANIRTVKNRIKILESREARTGFDQTINGLRVYENQRVGRLQLIFPDKPSEELRKKLKKRGFRWSPSQGAWQRHISPDALNTAKEIASIVNQ